MKMYHCVDILSLDDLVFWSAVSLAFRALLRASNICGRIHGVKLKDLKFVGENLHVMVRTSKTNQFAEYLSKIVVVFRRLIRGKWMRMYYTWFNTKLASITTLAGLGPGFSTHSLRRGGASHMNSLDYNLLQLKRRGCWQSDTVQKYIDVTDSKAVETDVKFAISLP